MSGLKKRATNNARVTRNNGAEKTSTVLKEGIPNDRKRTTSASPVVGVSIGSTINMGDFQSLRVDVWLSDEVRSNETVENAYARVTKTVNETLHEIVDSYTDD